MRYSIDESQTEHRSSTGVTGINVRLASNSALALGLALILLAARSPASRPAI